MHNSTSLTDGIQCLLKSKNPKSIFLARQLIFSQLPASHFIENFLNENSGKRQNLDRFPMMRPIYDHLPERLLLKCSRKTLKSTLLSNIIALNMIRWNYYNILYVGPQEKSVQYFSTHYINPRFDSPNIKKLFVKGWEKNDVYGKKLADTNSSVLLRYASEDATRIRGPATDHNIHDEVQDMNWEILPIIRETMALSPYKREYFAGTPLTTDNTINVLWLSSNQMEWATKCTGCNHWNMLVIDNNPRKMIQPNGYCCSRCGKLLDTTQGEWVTTAPTKPGGMIGYHLAQPLLPFFNQDKKEWDKFYLKVTDPNYAEYQFYNEALGLAFDIGAKPITEAELKALCILGPTKDENGNLLILKNSKSRYVRYVVGVDWGVSQVTSRTVACYAGLRNDGILEIFDFKVFKDQGHEEHIKEIADVCNRFQALCACDSGPDPIRGVDLAQQTSPKRTTLVRYENGKLIQRYFIPPGAKDWRQNRYCLHRSDTLSFVFRMLKAGKILFPDWGESKEVLKDILNEFIEVKDNGLVQELAYRHAPSQPDDFLHALNFATITAYSSIGDKILHGPSTTAMEISPHD